MRKFRWKIFSLLYGWFVPIIHNIDDDFDNYRLPFLNLIVIEIDWSVCSVKNVTFKEHVKRCFLIFLDAVRTPSCRIYNFLGEKSLLCEVFYVIHLEIDSYGVGWSSPQLLAVKASSTCHWNAADILKKTMARSSQGRNFVSPLSCFEMQQMYQNP